MRIAIVTHNLSFITGGPRLIFGLAEHLKEMGQEVVVYDGEENAADASGAYSDYFREISKGIRVHIVAQKSPSRGAEKPKGFLGWVFGKIREELNEVDLARTIAEAMDSDFDIVNLHDFCYRTGYFYKKRNPKTKVIWNENAPLFSYVKKGKMFYDAAGYAYRIFKNWMNRKYFRAMDKVVVLDRFNEAHSKTEGFHDITMVRAGIDFKKFYAPVKNFSEKASRKKVQLLAVGALNAYRRYDNVIDTVRLLREWGYDARAVIVANNIWHEDACRDNLQAMVEKYNLKPYVEFHFDGMPEEDLIKTFQESDIFIQAVYSPPPSHHGWGLVNFEAMAAGLPVVLVRSATATEVLKEEENVLLFDPLHAEQIAEKVKFLVDHPEEYARIAEAGQTYVKENQSWKKYADEMLNAFSETR